MVRHMSSRPFMIEIDEAPSACESLRHLLRSVPMDAMAHSSCEKVLHTVLPCTPGCHVMDRASQVGRLDSESTGAAPPTASRRERALFALGKEPEKIRDMSPLKHPFLALLGGSMVAFALIALGSVADHGEDFAPPSIEVTLPTSGADWILDSYLNHQPQGLIGDALRAEERTAESGLRTPLQPGRDQREILQSLQETKGRTASGEGLGTWTRGRRKWAQSTMIFGRSQARSSRTMSGYLTMKIDSKTCNGVEQIAARGILGAVIGGIAGGEEGAAIGAGAGSGAGTVFMLATKGDEIQLNPGQRPNVQMRAPLGIQVVAQRS